MWAVALRERRVTPAIAWSWSLGTVDWLEAVLGTWKIGGVVVPVPRRRRRHGSRRVVSTRTPFS